VKKEGEGEGERFGGWRSSLGFIMMGESENRRMDE